jgi:acetyl-CoA C-acetyltransferase
MNDAFIIDAVRIPRAKVNAEGGAYAHLKPVDLLSPLFTAISERNNLPSDTVEDVLLGCSTQSGEQGSNIAKIAALYAGWSDQVSGVTLNRFCCSGLDAINLAASKIMSGMESIVVAGGIEQISQVPMFSDKGPWFSNKTVIKKTKFLHMGLSADLIATQNHYQRKDLDKLAKDSHDRASHAQKNGYFSKSLITIKDKNGQAILAADNGVRDNISADKLAALPASFTGFKEMGQLVVNQVYTDELQTLHSPGNSPALVDGASLLLIASEDACQQYDLKPRARIRHFANASDEPVKMLTGHIRSTEKLLKACNLNTDDIDLWEVNESFAASLMNFRDHFKIDNDILNVNGSAIAMGHPLGATGGNLTSILLDELERRKLTRGIISICGGAGVGVTTLIERV